MVNRSVFSSGTISMRSGKWPHFTDNTGDCTCTAEPHLVEECAVESVMACYRCNVRNVFELLLQRNNEADVVFSLS